MHPYVPFQWHPWWSAVYFQWSCLKMSALLCMSILSWYGSLIFYADNQSLTAEAAASVDLPPHLPQNAPLFRIKQFFQVLPGGLWTLIFLLSPDSGNYFPWRSHPLRSASDGHRTPHPAFFLRLYSFQAPSGSRHTHWSFVRSPKNIPADGSHCNAMALRP